MYGVVAIAGIVSIAEALIRRSLMSPVVGEADADNRMLMLRAEGRRAWILLVDTIYN
jgi:hypothetical protein